jgi:hypothetical protein
MAGALGHASLDAIDRLTLREMLWLHDGQSYERWMHTGAIVAGLYNVQRTKTSDRVWTFRDFHPAHAMTHKAKTGRQVVQQTQGWFAADEIQWLPGYGPGGK